MRTAIFLTRRTDGRGHDDTKQEKVLYLIQIIITHKINMRFVPLILLALPLQSAATSLLGGKYEITTDVQDYLNLSRDAAAMKEADDLKMKQAIYENGRSGGWALS